MSKKESTAKKEPAVAKVEKPVIDIVRGRMPLAIVALIKFAPETVKDADLAAKYRTTSGKISDVRQGRNFGYITKDFKPTAEMITLAKAHAAKMGEIDADDINTELDAMAVASEAEATAFAESRKGSRKPRGKVKAEKPVDPAPVADAEEAMGDDDLEGLVE